MRLDILPNVTEFARGKRLRQSANPIPELFTSDQSYPCFSTVCLVLDGKKEGDEREREGEALQCPFITLLDCRILELGNLSFEFFTWMLHKFHCVELMYS